MKPDAVIFDNDGLLLDTEAVWTRAERDLYQSRGHDFTLADKRELVGTSVETASDILERRFGEPGRDMIAELQALVRQELERGVMPMTGAPELVNSLRQRGIPIGIVSNSIRIFLTRALDLAGLGEMFDVVVSAEDVPAAKPAPDPYLEACHRLGVASSLDVVALEDSPTGVASAKAAGLFVVGVPSLPGIELVDAHILAESLQDPRVTDLLLGD